MTQIHRLYLVLTWCFLFVFTFGSIQSYAQEEEMKFHELEPEDDAFQDAFFAAIRYKAIGNYRLALESLNTAEKEAGKSKEMVEVIRFERAQNHYYLGEYEESIFYFEDIVETPKKREVLSWLYQTYIQVRDYKNAKETIVQLLGYSEVYLPSFYMLFVERTNDAEKALQILESIFAEETSTRQVGFYKDLIKETVIENSGEKKVITETSNDEIEKLQSLLKEKNWEEAEIYMELLLQKESNASLIWEQLESTQDLNQAYNSLKKVLSSKNIPEKSMQSMLSVLLEKQGVSSELEQFLNQVYDNLDAKSLIEIGNYFKNNNNLHSAKRMYLKSLTISFDNYSLIIETLQLLFELEAYTEQLGLIDKAMDYYPMQPVLFLYKGKALLGMKEEKKALEVLEEGASYVIDQPELEKEFTDSIQKAKQ